MSTNIGSPSGLRYVSVCAGIEAATAAWHSLGWTPVLFSEIEPFPRAVLQHHYPDVPLIGDFTQMLPTADGPAIIPPPEADLLVGGTPCQAFSVAGKRLSLEDYRGNLSLAFADLYHAGNYRWAVWENVPGVLSTRDNAFGCLLGRLVGADGALAGSGDGKWPRAGVVAGPLAVASWRVCDAQFFGVAQRRQRVFVLVSRGAGNWAAPAALLPVGVGLSGDPAPRREAREGAAADAAGRARSGGAGGVRPLNTQIATRHEALGEGTGFGIGEVGDPAFTLQAGHSHGVIAPTDIIPALTGSGRGTERTGESRGQDPIVLETGKYPELPDIVGALSDGAHNGGGLNGQDAYSGRIIPECVTGDVTHALKADGFDGSEDGTGRGVPIVAGPLPLAHNDGMRQREGKPGGGKGPLLSEDQSLTLAANANDQVLFSPMAFHNRQDPDVSGDVTHPLGAKDNGMGVVSQCQGSNVSDPDDVSGTLRSGNGNETGGVPFTVGLRPRRLTPRECERLQGFPDDYTLVPFGRPSKKKLDEDYLKYLMRGNPKGLTAEQCAGLASDGPRYKSLGNSMAVDVMHWIGERIDLVERVFLLDRIIDFAALGLGEPDQFSLL